MCDNEYGLLRFVLFVYTKICKPFELTTHKSNLAEHAQKLLLTCCENIIKSRRSNMDVLDWV